MKKNVLAMNELSAYITSTAMEAHSSFPNVTLSQFGMFSDFAHEHVGFLTTLYAPIVSSSEREQWEAYAMQNQWWLNASDSNLNVESHESSEFIFHWVN